MKYNIEYCSLLVFLVLNPIFYQIMVKPVNLLCERLTFRLEPKYVKDESSLNNCAFNLFWLLLSSNKYFHTRQILLWSPFLGGECNGSKFQSNAPPAVPSFLNESRKSFKGKHMNWNINSWDFRRKQDHQRWRYITVNHLMGI